MNANPLALVLHGYGCHSKSYFLPHLQQLLESNQYQVRVPDLPNAHLPKPEQWIATAEEALEGVSSLNLLVAHSLGGSLALQLLSQNRLKTKKLVLISTSIGLENLTELGSFLSPPLNNHNIISNCEKIISVACVDDPWIDFEHAILHVKQLKASALLINGYGHFESSELPEELIKLIVD